MADRPQKNRSEKLLEELLEDGQPRPGDANPDNAWRLKHYFKAYTLEAIEKVATIMRMPGDPKLALAAAALILDRGWGRPVQQMEVGGPGDFAELNDEQLEEFISVTSGTINKNRQTAKH